MHSCCKQKCCAQHQELSGVNKGVKGDVSGVCFDFLCVTTTHNLRKVGEVFFFFFFFRGGVCLLS